jgi:proteasome lid subunit RPN8/RPN11
MEHGADTEVGTWSAPECPFEIEYSARVLDDIRLAVVEAFFSLPRGGAEIGGILLGQWDGGRISITDWEALDCEHATGPSFTLSPRDQTHLAEMTAKARRNASNRQPVGWYHSHTRSDIFLSETDQDIHNRFFPEPWQVALVLKPHTFEPTRGGFFFREPDGSIRGAASYKEFQLDQLPLRPASAERGNRSTAARRPLHEDSIFRARAGTPPATPAARPAAQPSAPPLQTAELLAVPPAESKGRVPITRELAIDPAITPAPNGQETAGEPPALDAPDFGQVRQERSWRAVKAAAILALGLAAGGVGYQTRQYWLPRVLTKARAVLPREPEPYLSLAVSDENGQLKIRWDRNAPAVRNALEATIEIADGNTVPQSVRLDNAHLASGEFIYARQNERVDVTLIASEPTGQVVKEQRSFLGKLPAQKGAAEDPQASKDRDAEAERAEKLQKDLNFQAAKTRKLEKDLKDMREQLEQKKQLDSPAPDPTKKN